MAAHDAPRSSGEYLISVKAFSGAAGLDFALRSLAPGGVCTGVGYYVTKRTGVPLMHMYANARPCTSACRTPARSCPTYARRTAPPPSHPSGSPPRRRLGRHTARLRREDHQARASTRSRLRIPLRDGRRETAARPLDPYARAAAMASRSSTVSASPRPTVRGRGGARRSGHPSPPAPPPVKRAGQIRGREALRHVVLPLDLDSQLTAVVLQGPPREPRR